jgi:hypothetical protein
VFPQARLAYGRRLEPIAELADSRQRPEPLWLPRRQRNDLLFAPLALPDAEGFVFVRLAQLPQHSLDEVKPQMCFRRNPARRAKREVRARQLHQDGANIIGATGGQVRRQIPAIDLVTSNQIGEDREPDEFQNLPFAKNSPK